MYNNKLFSYIKHTLYKINTIFDNHYIINVKLLQPIFNYPKFYAMTYFIQYIQDYNIIINYNTAYSKVVYKYFLKLFYKKINEKGYKL